MPDHYHVVIQPRASRDIISICIYIEQDSPQNAAQVAGEIIAAIDSLEFLPYRHKVNVSNRDPARVVRSMSVPPFIVYYRVVERNKAVEVITVRRGTRRQPRRF
jgi:plasmid stabilization system protein ParE